MDRGTLQPQLPLPPPAMVALEPAAPLSGPGLTPASPEPGWPPVP